MFRDPKDCWRGRNWQRDGPVTRYEPYYKPTVSCLRSSFASAYPDEIFPLFRVLKTLLVIFLRGWKARLSNLSLTALTGEHGPTGLGAFTDRWNTTRLSVWIDNWFSTNGYFQCQISNFEYLMQLNTLAGRSFNDLTQVSHTHAPFLSCSVVVSGCGNPVNSFPGPDLKIRKKWERVCLFGIDFWLDFARVPF